MSLAIETVVPNSIAANSVSGPLGGATSRERGPTVFASMCLSRLSSVADSDQPVVSQTEWSMPPQKLGKGISSGNKSKEDTTSATQLLVPVLGVVPMGLPNVVSPAVTAGFGTTFSATFWAVSASDTKLMVPAQLPTLVSGTTDGPIDFLHDAGQDSSSEPLPSELSAGVAKTPASNSLVPQPQPMAPGGLPNQPTKQSVVLDPSSPLPSLYGSSILIATNSELLQPSMQFRAPDVSVSAPAPIAAGAIGRSSPPGVAFGNRLSENGMQGSLQLASVPAEIATAPSPDSMEESLQHAKVLSQISPVEATRPQLTQTPPPVGPSPDSMQENLQHASVLTQIFASRDANSQLIQDSASASSRSAAASSPNRNRLSPDIAENRPPNVGTLLAPPSLLSKLRDELLPSASVTAEAFCSIAHFMQVPSSDPGDKAGDGTLAGGASKQATNAATSGPSGASIKASAAQMPSNKNPHSASATNIAAEQPAYRSENAAAPQDGTVPPPPSPASTMATAADFGIRPAARQGAGSASLAKPVADPMPAPEARNPMLSRVEVPMPGMGPVQMAQMLDRATHSEMRIGLNTSAFGNVEVRTLVQASDVGLVIGSEKGDLHSLLATELPGIVKTLEQQNLHLQEVNFHQGFSFSGGLSSGSDSSPRSFVPRPQAHFPLLETKGKHPGKPEMAEGLPSRHSGLSILV
jgi:hypothetical protein